ncbi:putative Huntington disease protein, partial [Operophtera brumata]
ELTDKLHEYEDTDLKEDEPVGATLHDGCKINIGSPCDDDVPLKYCARLLASKFLLTEGTDSQDNANEYVLERNVCYQDSLSESLSQDLLKSIDSQSQSQRKDKERSESEQKSSSKDIHSGILDCKNYAKSDLIASAMSQDSTNIMSNSNFTTNSNMTGSNTGYPMSSSGDVLSSSIDLDMKFDHFGESTTNLDNLATSFVKQKKTDPKEVESVQQLKLEESIEREFECQHMSDIFTLLEGHSDPQIRGVVRVCIGNYLLSALEIAHGDYGRWRCLNLLPKDVGDNISVDKLQQRPLESRSGHSKLTNKDPTSLTNVLECCRLFMLYPDYRRRSKQILDTLIRLLADQDHKVRNAASQAIARLVDSITNVKVYVEIHNIMRHKTTNRDIFERDAQTTKRWQHLENDRVASLAEKFLQVTLKMLNVLVHLIEEVNPNVHLNKGGIALPGTPVRRKTQDSIQRKNSTTAENLDDKGSLRKKPVPATSLKANFTGHFYNEPYYMKFYESLRATYSNHKVISTKPVPATSLKANFTGHFYNQPYYMKFNERACVQHILITSKPIPATSLKANFTGHFYNEPYYMKFYESLRATYSNHKVISTKPVPAPSLKANFTGHFYNQPYHMKFNERACVQHILITSKPVPATSLKANFKGHFYNEPYYMKFYESLRATYSIHKVISTKPVPATSLKANFKGHFYNQPYYMKFNERAYVQHILITSVFYTFLRTVLNCLALQLELATEKEIGTITEEVLYYLKVILPLCGDLSVYCITQLLKCLFGTNMINQYSDFMSITDKIDDQKKLSFYEDVLKINPLKTIDEESRRSSVCSTASQKLSMDVNSKIAAEKQLLIAMENFAKNKSDRKWSTNKKELERYIRLFEPTYTMQNDIPHHRQVLSLLNQLLTLRVNYCMLDSDQLLQLCDGLMASGAHAECIAGLEPVAVKVFSNMG